MSTAKSKDRVNRAARVTSLFEVGREVVLDDNPDDPVLVWVAKMNPFETEDARRDGQVGRARALNRLEDPQDPDGILFERALVDRDDENLVQGLVYADGNEHYVQALDDLRSDEAWVDKIALLERWDEQLADAGAPEDDDERRRMAELNQAYMAAVNERMEELAKEAQRVFEQMSSEELREAYIKSYRDQVARNGYLTEYRTSELYYSVRDCTATLGQDLRWDHKACTHRRLYESRAEVREAPEELLLKVREALNQLAITPAEAGNSAAPTSSSASSEQRSRVEESTPSTPAAT